MKKIVTLVVPLTLMLTGCGGGDEAVQEGKDSSGTDAYYGKFESKDEGVKRLSRSMDETEIDPSAVDHSAPKKRTPLNDPEADSYNNEELAQEGRALEAHLTQSPYVTHAQVVVTNDTIYANVKERMRAGMTRVDVVNMVERELKQLAQEKEIIVFSANESHWGRKKDDKARPNQRLTDDQLREELNHFYNSEEE
ncbi:hypothetical protein N781_10710 [Pontibacillus halophilus JSM 076056 = DSM 19796]|uniref:Sporulation protein n=1 Tax=Pontibacillus halophilus JSM 076056 = DSM 19796 TaxID=1385510 RepID=A0A0A5ICR3_9BACI|nr:YhcN/YlaJ family sporulation lipoprotein [Pontibacillus halophilus]KGX93632.1 hypothetical protein N781_10710 [Pontibacillus halophilus JSM 076056 = DSM 19796]